MNPTSAFDRNSVPREMRPFMDEAGRVTQWPAKQKTQRMIVDYLARKFEPGREYPEQEVNFLLMNWHTFQDWAILRRLLFNWGYLDRESDGTRYRMRPEREWPKLEPGRGDSPAASPEHGANAPEVPRA